MDAKYATKPERGVEPMRIYKGYLIEHAFPSGYWKAFVQGHGTLVADTLQGLKALIRETLN